MRTLLKGIAVLIGLVFAFVILASIYVALFFDANSYKPEIEKAVRDATGREFAIEGELSLSLFPWLALDAGRMTLGNAEGFGDELFFELDSASFSMRLWPALTRKELSIGKASIEGLAVNLAVDENGRANWDDMVERFEVAEEAEEAAPPADEAESEGASASLELNVERIAVLDAAFSYRDAQEGTAVSVDAINLETGRIAEGEPLPLSASFAFAVEPNDIAGTVEMRVTADTADDDRVRLDGLELLARIEGRHRGACRYSPRRTGRHGGHG
jgi:AsmA protein